MSRKISQLTTLLQLSGEEYIPAVINNRNYKIKTSILLDLVSKDALGIDQVDNTSDLDKPISTATQDALDNKVNSGNLDW